MTPEQEAFEKWFRHERETKGAPACDPYEAKYIFSAGYTAALLSFPSSDWLEEQLLNSFILGHTSACRGCEAYAAGLAGECAGLKESLTRLASLKEAQQATPKESA